MNSVLQQIPRVTVDNCFFNQNLLDQNKIINYFENRQITFYPSLELIGEFLCMGRQKLEKFCPLFLRMKGKRIINSWRDLLLKDVGIEQTSLYIDKGLEFNLGQIFYKISNNQKLGHNENKLIDFVKKKIEDGKKSMGCKYRKSSVQYNGQADNIGFDQFFNKHGLNIRRGIIKKIYQDNKKTITDEESDRAATDFNNRPYFSTYSRIHMGLFYFHNVKKRKIKDNDFYDHLYLMYLVNVDYLVTCDRKLIDLYKLIFPGEDRVVQPGDLCQMVLNR